MPPPTLPRRSRLSAAWAPSSSPGQTVGISLNANGAVACAHTDLEVLRTVVDLCKRAGAAEVRVLSWIERDRMEFNRLWERVPQTGAAWHEVSQEDPELWRWVDCPRGVVLKGIRIFKAIEEPDVYIGMPKFKHHSSVRLTGALKLAMATTIRVDNRTYMHVDKSAKLEQCIADLNLIARRPDLIVSDAMEVLTLRGPKGPGPTVKPQCVVAGSDPVAVDAYCSPFLGIPAAQSVQITAAHAHGLGELDLSKLQIKEIELA